LLKGIKKLSAGTMSLISNEDFFDTNGDETLSLVGPF